MFSADSNVMTIDQGLKWLTRAKKKARTLIVSNRIPNHLSLVIIGGSSRKDGTLDLVNGIWFQTGNSDQ